jgi:hypothetical protein
MNVKFTNLVLENEYLFLEALDSIKIQLKFN